MATMAALGRRLRELSRAAGGRGVQTPPGDPSPEDPCPEFSFVQRLLPPSRIPAPPQHCSYPTPSGWSPPRGPSPDLPFFVRRSRLHNLPVYRRGGDGCRRLTELRGVQGDIWELERQLKEMLKGCGGKEPAVKVNEACGSLLVKGHWEQELKAWLLEKGF